MDSLNFCGSECFITSIDIRIASITRENMIYQREMTIDELIGRIEQLCDGVNTFFVKVVLLFR